MTASTATAAAVSVVSRLPAKVELGKLTMQLSDVAEAILFELLADPARPPRCIGEITSFTLERVLDILPIADCRLVPSARHFFIDSQSTSAELRAYERHCLDRAPGELFVFSVASVCGSWLAAARLLAGVAGGDSVSLRLLEACNVDALYIPIYDDPAFPGDYTMHCSLLIYIAGENRMVLFDSIAGSGHQRRAQRIISMLSAAGLLSPHGFQLNMPLTKQQLGVTECGWCALLFANWWRTRTAGDQPPIDMTESRSVHISTRDIEELARRILREQHVVKSTAAYHDRLQRAFFVLRERAFMVQR